MAVKITTAIDGDTLRKYAERVTGDPGICVFPEARLSPSEQASFVQQNGYRFDEIITFSSFIISDAEDGCVTVLDRECHGVRHGDSINKVCMNLWRRETIGDVVESKFENVRLRIERAETDSVLELLLNEVAYSFGDSVEKLLLMNVLNVRMKAIESQSR